MNIDEGIQKLVNLSERQGYVTYDDINSTFREYELSPEELDEICVKLHNLGIEFIDHPLGGD